MNFQSVVTNKPGPSGADDIIATVADAGKKKQTPPGIESNRTDTGYALVVADLSKSFKSGFLRKKIRGIDGVSFTVKKGQVFAILGHNGAGKTTTINCILDLVHPDRGEVDILGCSAQTPASRLQVGYLPERPYFFEHLSGQELLEFYGKLLDLPAKGMAGRIDEVLQRVGMTEFRNRKLRKYSKGMLQRIGLAQAILGKPDLLILDEPMSGLDPSGRKDVRELLLELKASGCTIILSSHIVPDVEMLADSVVILKEGRVALQEDLHQLSGNITYSVNLVKEGVSAELLPTWARRQFIPSGPPTAAIIAGSVVQLQELLATSNTHNFSILSVETQSTALEDLFMKANNTQEDKS